MAHFLNSVLERSYQKYYYKSLPFEYMQLSTNMSFNAYLEQMSGVLNQLNFDLSNSNENEFNQILEVLVFKLGKTHVDWNNSSSNKLNLSYDGTVEGICDIVLSLVTTVLKIIYNDTPKISGDLDIHIMRVLMIQFSIRLLFRQTGNELDPLLGEVRIDNVVGTIHHKPVKLYNIMRESLLRFMTMNFPDAIILLEQIDEETKD